MSERTAIGRLKALWAEKGPFATFADLVSYVRWRLSGSPADPMPNTIPTYQDWLDSYADLRPDRTLPDVGFSIVCPVFNTPPELLGQCVDSVRAQTHSRWELILIDDASSDSATKHALEAVGSLDERVRIVTLEENCGIAVATNVGIDLAEYEYTVFMDHDDLLAPSALEWLSTCCPSADLIYTDEDKIDETGSHWAPFFKPAWSPRLLLGVNYVNHATCVRTGLLRDVGALQPGTDGVQDHDLLLRLAERDLTVAHVPFVSYHWRAWKESVAGNPSSKVDVEQRGLEAIDRAISRRGWNAHAALGNGAPFNYRVIFDRSDERPSVKVVIPTRDRVGMLRRVVEGLLNRTDGVRLHIVVVDNGSEKAKTMTYLEEIGRRDDVTVVRIDDAFNYSLLCNRGVAAGPDAPYVLFLNNDVEILHRAWLQQMIGWLQADEHVVGVGAKLLFPDLTIQHAGVIIGFGGIAGHYAAREPDQPRLGNLHDQAREVACLTAACLAVRTADFQAVGGFNETLSLDFQDVDLCLRLRTVLGGELVYDPTFPMIHRESASRGSAGASSGYTVARMRFLWGEVLASEDPYYNPHLSLGHHDFSLRELPTESHGRLERLIPRISSVDRWDVGR